MPEIDATQFPRAGTSEDQLRFLLRYALLAPSSHNTQPWRWEIADDEVSLFADRSRVMPTLDPEGRELIMSCGAALEHLRIAMHAFGCEETLSLVPDADRPDLLARIRLVAYSAPSDTILFDAMPHRHTNRKHFKSQPLEEKLLDGLQSEVGPEGVWLHFITNSGERDLVASLVAVGADIQSCNKEARNDIADWMAPNDGTRRDGIPGYAQGIGDSASYIAGFWLRIFGPVTSQADYDWDLARNAPVLAVLGTAEEGTIHWLSAGRALARILLRATAEGVAVSFFSQPIQVDSLWSELRRIIKQRGVPQLVFRLGYAEDDTVATPRRTVDEVTGVTQA